MKITARQPATAGNLAEILGEAGASPPRLAPIAGWLRATTRSVGSDRRPLYGKPFVLNQAELPSSVGVIDHGWHQFGIFDAESSTGGTISYRHHLAPQKHAKSRVAPVWRQFGGWHHLGVGGAAGRPSRPGPRRSRVAPIRTPKDHGWHRIVCGWHGQFDGWHYFIEATRLRVAPIGPPIGRSHRRMTPSFDGTIFLLVARQVG